MFCRGALAALDHNSNIDRTQVGGREQISEKLEILPHSARRKNLSYPKGMKDGPKSGCIFAR
jgi:hypothetical protein